MKRKQNNPTPYGTRHAMKEARRLGMSDEEIVDYLNVTWLDENEVRRLARHLGVRVSRKHSPGRRAPTT